MLKFAYQNTEQILTLCLCKKIIKKWRRSLFNGLISYCKSPNYQFDETQTSFLPLSADNFRINCQCDKWFGAVIFFHTAAHNSSHSKQSRINNKVPAARHANCSSVIIIIKIGGGKVCAVVMSGWRPRTPPPSPLPPPLARIIFSRRRNNINCTACARWRRRR
jgi:hypothetical protein